MNRLSPNPLSIPLMLTNIFSECMFAKYKTFIFLMSYNPHFVFVKYFNHDYP